jgi:hypothetical protein
MNLISSSELRNVGTPKFSTRTPIPPPARVTAMTLAMERSSVVWCSCRVEPPKVQTTRAAWSAGRLAGVGRDEKKSLTLMVSVAHGGAENRKYS